MQLKSQESTSVSQGELSYHQGTQLESVQVKVSRTGGPMTSKLNLSLASGSLANTSPTGMSK
jgi:hypothetical protein